MSNLRVSVVVPSYNYGRYISEAIEGALAQTLAPFEVLVVDDGSTDNTGRIIQEFGNRVRHLHQENAGVSAARNRGAFASSGELIAFLDADDIWEPGKLEMQVARFESDPAIGLVHCGFREFDSDTGKTLRFHVEGGDEGTARDLLLWERPSINVSGSLIMVSRNAFETVGGFDTRLKCGEDWDFCYRVAREFKVGFVPEPLVNYRAHAAAAHMKIDEMERGMALFYEKAFATHDPDILKLKRRAYGNYHRVLSGSYFRARNYRKFVEHAIKSIRNRPTNLAYFLRFPLRRLGGYE